ncbi:MAG: YncE family protein [bacterium]|nr:YncE family protein [bacterium]
MSNNITKNIFSYFFIKLFIALCAFSVIGCGGSSTADPPPPDNDFTPQAAVPKNIIQVIPDPAIDNYELNEPWGIAIAPDGAHVYVANAGDGSLAVIRTSDNRIIDRVQDLGIPTATLPKDVAVHPDGSFVYVTGYNEDTIYVIDTADYMKTEEIDAGNKPSALTVAQPPSGVFLYVANSSENTVSVNTVSVIDCATNTVVDEIDVGEKPYDLAATPDGEYVYVANKENDNNADTVSVIRTQDNTVIATLTVGNSPQGIAATDNNAYVSNFEDDTVSVIGTDDFIDFSVLTTINPKDEDNGIIGIGNTPMGITLTPDGTYGYVANLYDGTVSVFQTADNLVLGEIELDWVEQPRYIAITPDGQRVYVTSRDNSVVVIGY